MQGDIVIPMPTDLRSNIDVFELQEQKSGRKGLAKLTVNVPTSSHRDSSDRPPRWSTPEFIFYYLVAVIVIPMMTWVPISLSSPLHPNYPMYRRKLSRGWMLDRDIDNSDLQYRSFRNNLPALLILASAFLIGKHVYLLFRRPDAADKLFLIPYSLTFSILMLLGLHGTSILKILLILSLNYVLAKSCKASKFGPALTWILNLGILFANEWNAGYRFASIHPALETLDRFQGVYPRWHISFNITMLRLVSFNMDYHWAGNRAGPSDTGSALTDKQRTAVPHPLQTYSLKHYLAYVLYPPLYIAGPIITFNDFMWQFRRPPQKLSQSVSHYLIRFLVSFLTMEFILHYMYVVAIKDTKAWAGDTPAQLSMIGFWNLVIVWLKLLLPWRFFRLWALADGIDPPENMIRCVANNYSTFGFWRSWHRSYNLWIIRYMYIPLGGTKHVAMTSVLIFSFVAVWHDLSFRLLAWGWLVSLFIFPELCARFILPVSKYGSEPWYRHVCAAGAVVNILMMMAANLVGFVVGTDSVSYFFKELLGTSEGMRFFAMACVCLFIAAQLMFEYREEEMRQGIYRRC